jgi:predicted 2-oxoglutarate/Fe(II)-dependent dioxygenase YbiX
MSLIYRFTPKKLEELSHNLPSDQIFLLENFISDELCDKIRTEIEHRATIDETEIVRDTNVKCKNLVLEDKDLTTDNIIRNKLRKFGTSVNRKYGVNTQYIEDTNYRKIYGNTRLHVDGVNSKSTSKSAKRSLSIIICLNDDYEGGDFVFPSQKRDIKLKKGQLIAFPPYWSHPHYTNDLKNGTFRYTINTWFYEF